MAERQKNDRERVRTDTLIKGRENPVIDDIPLVCRKKVHKLLQALNSAQTRRNSYVAFLRLNLLPVYFWS